MYQKVNSWFDIVALEKQVLAFWQEHEIFQKVVKQNEQGQTWSFLDGPITANNPMGVHHAWGRTLKDLYQRYWAMNGRKLRYQNGFDCQGLWVEVEVEKELGFNSKRDIENYGVDRFVQKCKDRVAKYSDVITQQSVRLGYWMDWDNSYYTMSDENNYTIWAFLKKCHDKGLVYKGHDVMPWCPRCGTGISQHEMQEGYKETKHLSVIVRFPILNREREAFLVWTTTPWTLTANVAVAVKPDAVYLKAKQGDWTYYLVKSRAEAVLKGHGTWEVLEELSGSELVNRGLSYAGPFDELAVQNAAKAFHTPIPWKEVTEAEGTGIVHIAPGCGAEDFALGKAFHLPLIAPIDETGLFTQEFDWLAGQHASNVTPDIVRNLTEKDLFYAGEEYAHMYPHCWRCGKELLFRLVDEWYVAMDQWREEIKNVAKQIEWIPSFGLDLELDWLTNMRDWMISKKRYWGLALPIWECPDCQDFTVIGSYAELKERAVAGWENFDGHSPHKPWIDEVKIACPHCGKAISRIPDVGNPWLDAGIVTYSTTQYNADREHWKTWMPADLILECFPGQYRHWFYSLVTMSTMLENMPPCKTILGHALVRDERGEEMHKSKGNAIWFDDAAEKMGTEIMRWMFCTQELTSNLNFGYEKAKLVRGKFFNTLWNCYAFFANYARLIHFMPPAAPSDVRQRPDFDRWILSKLHLLIGTCRKSFEAHDVRTACRNIEEFVELLSTWYIRNNRGRYWRTDLDADTQYAYETLLECLSTLLRLLAPILPMLTEICYQNLRLSASGSPESVHLTRYPMADESLIDAQLVADMDAVVKVNKLALSAREKAKVKIRQPLAKLLVAPGNNGEKRAIARFADVLKSGLNVKQIELLDVKADCPLELHVKLLQKSAGEKYRAQAGILREYLEKHAASLIENLKNDLKQVDLDLLGGKITMTIDDLVIEEMEPKNLSVVKNNDGWLAFDLELTEELRLEGMMRDFLRQMQVLRKDVGLEVEHRIAVAYKTDSPTMRKAIKQHKEYLCNELLCVKLQEQEKLATDRHFAVAGDKIWVDIRKVHGN